MQKVVLKEYFRNQLKLASEIEPNRKPGTSAKRAEFIDSVVKKARVQQPEAFK